jgi:hypothetical protein
VTRRGVGLARCCGEWLIALRTTNPPAGQPLGDSADAHAMGALDWNAHWFGPTSVVPGSLSVASEAKRRHALPRTYNTFCPQIRTNSRNLSWCDTQKSFFFPAGAVSRVPKNSCWVFSSMFDLGRARDRRWLLGGSDTIDWRVPPYRRIPTGLRAPNARLIERHLPLPRRLMPT